MMNVMPKLKWMLFALPLAILLGSCGSDDDGGGDSAGPDTGPTAPAPIEVNSDLVQNPDVPPQLQGVAAMATGLSQAGNAYLGMATGHGTSIGHDCWQWTVTDQGVTVMVEACEEYGGSIAWSVSYSDGSAPMCQVMLGQVSADGLSGSWTFRDCPDNPDDKLMETFWSGDAQGNTQIEFFIWAQAKAAAASAPREDAEYYFLYQENADGTGHAEWHEAGVLVWTLDWSLDGDTLNAEFCEYEGGVLVECTDINEGYDGGR